MYAILSYIVMCLSSGLSIFHYWLYMYDQISMHVIICFAKRTLRMLYLGANI